MNTLFLAETLLDISNFAVSLGAVLLVQSSLLLAAGLITAFLFRKKGAALQSLVLRTTLAAVFFCPLVSWMLGLAGIEGSSLQLPKAGTAVMVAVASNDQPDRAELSAPTTESAPLAVSNVSTSSETPARMAANESREGKAVEPRPASSRMSDSSSFGSRLKFSNLALLYGVLTVIWLAGALVLLVPLVLCHARIGRVRWQAGMADVEVFERCQAIAQELKVSAPEVLAHCDVKSPLLVGLFRPAILLPALPVRTRSTASLNSRDVTDAMERVPTNAIASREVLVHELAHLARGDCLWHFLGRIATALLFFQPLLWMLVRRIEETAEEVCDNYVIEQISDRRAYARQLVDLAERLQFPRGEAAVGVGVIAFKSALGQRIVRLLDDSRNVSVRTGAMPIFATALAFILSTGMIACIGNGAEPNSKSQVKNGELKGGQRLQIGAQPGRRDLQFSAESSVPSNQKPAPALSLRVLPVPEQFLSGEIAVSSDGRSMVVGRYSPKATEFLDLTTGNLRFITNLFVTSPRFSPNGKEIAVTGYYDSENTNHVMSSEIVLIDLETHKARRLYQNDEANYMRITDWSADGRTILFIFKKKNQSRSWHIATVSVGDGSSRVVKSLERWASFAGTLCFSPDGRWIVYDAPNGANDSSPRDLYLISSDGSQEIPLRPHAADDFVLGWASLDDQVLFASNRRGNWDAFAIRVKGGKPVGEPELVKEAVGRGRPLGITRSGAFFYRVETSSKDVYVATLDKVSGKMIGTPAKVPCNYEGHAEYPDWSRDGRFLSCGVSPQSSERSAGSSLIWIRNMLDGSQRELKLEGGPIWAPRWSPDGSLFIASGIERQRYALFRVDALTGKAALLPVSPGTSSLAGWAPEGNAFYYQTGKAIVRRDIQTGAETRFPSATNTLSISFEEHTPAILSPDTRNIAFRWSNSTNSQSIYTSALNGGELRQLVEVPAGYWIQSYDIIWTPDNRHLIFLKELWEGSKWRSSTLCRVPVSGGQVEELGDMMEGTGDLRISPDGEHLAFTVRRSKRDIWVMENFLPKDNAAAK